MSNEVTSPFTVFFDRSGEPLDAGYIYIGTAGINPEVSPIAVYWDSNLTTTAAQPIRTLAGYPSRNGSPSGLFLLQSSYSILVKDKNGALVFSDLNFSSVSAIQGNTITVNTFADLTALPLSSLINNYIYYTAFRATADDGGEGNWRYDSASTETANGRTILARDGGGAGRFIRLDRYRFKTATTIYVNHASGNNSTNGGWASSDAFATVTFAYKFLRDWVDCGGQKLVIQIADGTFDEFVVCHGPVLGLQAAAAGAGFAPEGSSSIIIRGNLVTKAACYNSRSDTNPCFSFAQGARVRVEGIKFSNPSATDNLFKVYADTRVEVGQVVVGTGSPLTAQLQAADSGTIVGAASSDSSGWIEWAGGAGIGIVCEVGTGVVSLADVRFDGSVTFVGHPASAFVNCGEGAYFHASTFTGTFTGRKYWVSENAVISDAGVTDIENIPGSLPGVRTSSTVAAPGTRLTLTSGLPVTVSDVTASTSVYLAPNSDKYVLVRNSVSRGLMRQTIPAAGISLRLNATDHVANTNYDVFTYSLSEGTAVIATGPAWTNDTTRSAAISQVDGTWVNTSSMTLRYDNAAAGTTTSVTAGAGQAAYVGTIRTVAAGQTEDSLAKRFVWNTYNRVSRAMYVIDGTDTWTYSISAWQQANASTVNQLAVVRGLNEDAVTAIVNAEVSNSTSTIRSVRTGIGLDATNAIAAGCVVDAIPAYNGAFFSGRASWTGFPGLGYHIITRLEYGNDTGAETQTWRGDAGAPTIVQTGIQAEVWA